MRPSLEIKYQIQEKIVRHEKQCPYGYIGFRVFLYTSVQMRCSLASRGTAENCQNKNLVSQRTKPSGRYGKTRPRGLASSRPARRSQSAVPAAQERTSPICCQTDQRTRADGSKTSPTAAELKRLCPPQFLRTGDFLHAAFVLNVAKVKRDGYLAKAKKLEIARVFETGKHPIPEKLTGNEYRCQRVNCVFQSKTTDKEIY